jgi:hypothetical protein
VLVLWTSGAAAWGPQAHRVAGAVAWDYLSPGARTEIRRLIGDEPLGEASNWADRMRDDPRNFWQKQAGPFHYVTVPPGNAYADIQPPAKGDAVTALAEFSRILRDPGASRSSQQLALRFSLHIIQDLHQPMHVGNGRDRGGNDISLVLYEKRTNLHRVWDSAVIGYGRPGDQRLVSELQQLLRQNADQWQQPDPDVWIQESAMLRDRVYPETEKIDASYLARHRQDAVLRLAQSAVRCAAYFNQLFASSVDVEAP